MPADQEEKLMIIEDMAMVLGSQARSFPALKMDNDPIPGITNLIKTIDAILPQKTDAREIQILSGFKKELQDILLELSTRQEPDRSGFIEKIQTTLLGTLPNAMNELYASFDAKEIALTDLPPDIKDRWLSKDGLYRIQILPKKDLNDLANLEEFITDVQAVAPRYHRLTDHVLGVDERSDLRPSNKRLLSR